MFLFSTSVHEHQVISNIYKILNNVTLSVLLIAYTFNCMISHFQRFPTWDQRIFTFYMEATLNKSSND